MPGQKISHILQTALAFYRAFQKVGAFLAGSTLKKWLPAKLAPQLSPNKTIVGAVGGLVGGIAGSLLALGVMYLFGGVNEPIILGFNNVFLQFKPVCR